MAKAKTSAPLAMPPKGEMIAATSMYLQQISLYRNTLAFGGNRNPSSIWATMTYNNAETMAYYRELEDKDEDVANCLDSLKLSVLERDRSVIQNPRDESSLALETKEFIENQLDKLDFHAILDCILDAPGYGFSVQEMMFDVSMGQCELLGINDCPQELFLFGDRFYPQVGPLQLLDNPWASHGLPVPEQKFIIFSYRKRSRNRMGRPLLKSVFWPSWFKRNVQRLWMQYAEKGPGTAVVRYNDANNASERQQAVDVAQAIIDNVAIAIPKGLEYDQELLKIARANDPKVYENFFKAMQYSIARRVLGETLTSFGNEGGGGSKAQGDTHADTLDKRSVELCRSLESVINEQLIKPLVLWNFGPNAPMPRWQFNLEEAEDLSSRILIDAALQKMGVKFTAGYISDSYDRPLAKGVDPDDELMPTNSGPQIPSADVIPEVDDGSDGQDGEDGEDNNAPDFSEGGMPAAMRSEMKEYDKLFEQLQGEASDIYRKRISEIASATVPR